MCRPLIQDRLLEGKAASPGLRWPHQNPFPTALLEISGSSSVFPLLSWHLSEPMGGRKGMRQPTEPSSGFPLPRALSPALFLSQSHQSFRCLSSCSSPDTHAPTPTPTSHCSFLLPHRSVPHLLTLHSDVTTSMSTLLDSPFLFPFRMVSPSSFTTKGGLDVKKGKGNKLESRISLWDLGEV